MKRPSENNGNDPRRKCLKTSSSTLDEGQFGLIEKVSVQNFMCHENLTLNFEPHMNFIIGQNGSGKSAILTAIILALGGKSSSTDRFTNIKGFVKTGKNKAKIEVVLRNRGEPSYKKDVYGEKIIVVREFNKEGVSSYKIKSASGTICSNQKSELTSILEAMDIMIECPVCVLTQATSKKFLISKEAKAERLFEFFYKGTGLEFLENKYKSMKIMKEEAEAELCKKKQTLPDLRKDLEKWKKFLDSSKKIGELRNELIWAGVINMEKCVQEDEEKYRKSKDDLEEHKRDLEALKKSLDEKNAELDQLNQDRMNHDTEMKTCRQKLESVKAETENNASSYRRNKGSLQKLENDKRQLEKDILDLEKCINEQKKKDQRNLEEERKAREAEVKKLKDKNTELHTKWTNLEELIKASRSEQTNLQNARDNYSVDLNQHTYELKRIEGNLSTAKNAALSAVNAFGNHTDKVLQEIKRSEPRFKKLPLGPLGTYLDLKDSKWAAAVEFAIGSSLLDSFCVDNHQDSLILREILKKYYPQNPPSIIVSRYEPQMFDVSNGRVQSAFPSVLDMIEVKHYQVANCLIDQASIEKKILYENEKDGVSVMNDPPRNCNSAYCLNCDQICFNPSRMYSFGKKTAKSRLSGFKLDEIKKLEKYMEEKTMTIAKIKKQRETMESALRLVPNKIENYERELVKTKTDYKRNKMEIEEKQSREDTKNVDCLQEDLEALCRSCEQKEQEIEKCSEIVSKLEEKKSEQHAELDRLTTQLQASNEKYQEVLTKMRTITKRKESFATGAKKYEQELKNKENTCKSNHDRWESKKTKLEIACSKAESACERINPGRSYEELTRLIEETEKEVVKRSNCDRETLSKKYQEKLENLNKAEFELRRIEQYLVRTDSMLNTRCQRFQLVRKNTELLIQVAFTTILAGNGYSGELEFNAVDRTLFMKVSPRSGESKRKNHSSLSGGERSFVTIAFLLSLWERTQMPFRILDEYDVFMDSNNRQLSVDLLCKKAIQMYKTQFIFLSPLDLGKMPESDCIQILKMAPPKRKGDQDENSPRKKL